MPSYLGIMVTRQVQFCCIFAATKDKFDYFLKKLFHSSTSHTYHHNSSWFLSRHKNIYESYPPPNFQACCPFHKYYCYFKLTILPWGTSEKVSLVNPRTCEFKCKLSWPSYTGWWLTTYTYSNNITENLIFR